MRRNRELIELFYAQREFSAYGPSHWVVLAIFAIGAALLVWAGRRQSESQARVFGRVLALLIVAAFGVALVYKLIRPHLDTSVPLQRCAMSRNSRRPTRCGRSGIGPLCSAITGASC